MQKSICSRVWHRRTNSAFKTQTFANSFVKWWAKLIRAAFIALTPVASEFNEENKIARKKRAKSDTNSHTQSLQMRMVDASHERECCQSFSTLMMKMDQESIRCRRPINGKPYMTDAESAGTVTDVSSCFPMGGKPSPLTNLSCQKGKKVHFHQLFMGGEPEASVEFPVSVRQRKHGKCKLGPFVTEFIVNTMWLLSGSQSTSQLASQLAN